MINNVIIDPLLVRTFRFGNVKRLPDQIDKFQRPYNCDLETWSTFWGVITHKSQDSWQFIYMLHYLDDDINDDDNNNNLCLSQLYTI